LTDQCQIQKIFKVSEPDNFEIIELGFARWWRTNRGKVIRDALIDEGIPRALTIFTVTGLGLALMKNFSIFWISAFFVGPVGLAIIGAVAVISSIIIAGLSIYQQYNIAKRNFEVKITKDAIQEHADIHANLDAISNNVDDVIREYYQPSQTNVHIADIRKDLKELKYEFELRTIGLHTSTPPQPLKRGLPIPLAIPADQQLPRRPRQTFDLFDQYKAPSLRQTATEKPLLPGASTGLSTTQG